jgi:hypothetical protein
VSFGRADGDLSFTVLHDKQVKRLALQIFELRRESCLVYPVLVIVAPGPRSSSFTDIIAVIAQRYSTLRGAGAFVEHGCLARTIAR